MQLFLSSQCCVLSAQKLDLGGSDCLLLTGHTYFSLFIFNFDFIFYLEDIIFSSIPSCCISLDQDTAYLHCAFEGVRA